MNSLKKKGLFLALISFTFLGISPALAHTSMITQIPLGNSTISELPAQVELTFDETLISLGHGNKVSVLDPKGEEITIGEETVNNSVLSRDLKESKLSGTYRVKYRVVSADGHVVEGAYKFVLATKSGVTATSTPKADPTPSATSQTSAPHPAEHESFLHAHQIHIVEGAIALAAIGLWWVYRRFERSQER